LPPPLDLAGKRFGSLTAIRRVRRGRRNPWLWRCTCGVEKVIEPYPVTRGKIYSCGCSRDRFDIRGQTFNRLTAIEQVPGARGVWLWRYSCGRLTRADVSAVRRGFIRSCGCGRAEATRLRWSRLREKKKAAAVVSRSSG
jgi:hypothetical protein